jgi:hypothetical protein
MGAQYSAIFHHQQEQYQVSNGWQFLVRIITLRTLANAAINMEVLQMIVQLTIFVGRGVS